MSFIINGQGERVHVNMEVEWFSQTVPLYADDADLKEVFFLNLYKRDMTVSSEAEFIKTIEFDEMPTKEQIMHHMWKSGLSRYDAATIEKGYVLDWNETE